MPVIPLLSGPGSPPPGGVTPPTPAPTYTVQIVKMNGTLVRVLAKACKVTDVTRERNKPRTATLALHPMHADTAYMKTLNDEIQIYRSDNPNPIFWGFIDRPQRGHASGTYQLIAPDEYLNRLLIGRPRHNYVGNPNFAADAVGSVPALWHPPTGVAPDSVGATAPDAAAVVANNSVLLPHGFQLNVGSRNRNSYYWTEIAPPPGPNVIIAGWYWIQTANFRGPAYRSRVLRGEAVSATGRILASAEVTDDGRGPKERWTRQAFALGVPPATSRIRILAYAIGWTVWGFIECVLPESLSYINNTDEGEVVGSLVDHSQDPSIGKDNKNLSRSHTTTGIIRERTFRFIDRTPFGQGIDEFVGIEDGVDVSCELTPSSRTVTAWYPYRGTARATVLKYAMNGTGNCSDYTYSEDGNVVATSITALANGPSDEAREEVTKIDTSVIPIVLEATVTSPVGAEPGRLGDLADLATRQLHRRRQPPKMLELTTADLSLLGNVEEGDSFPCVVDAGGMQLAETMVVAKVVEYPLDLKLKITLNDLATAGR